MVFEGFTPYDSDAAKHYSKQRWWLGLTLGDMLDKTCDLYPEREALVGPEARYTWSEVRQLVDQMAYNLLQEGFEPGDTVLLQLPNWPEFVISYFALQKAGLGMVLLTVNHTAREIAHLSQLTRTRGWIVPAKYRKTNFLPVIKRVKNENSNL